MGKSLVSIVAVAAVALTLWVLYLKNPEPASSGELKPVAIAPEQEAPSPNLSEVEAQLSSTDSDLVRSALGPTAVEASSPGPIATEPVAEQDKSDSLIEVLVVDATNKPIPGATVAPNEVTGGSRRLIRSWTRSSSPQVTNENGLVFLSPTSQGLMRLVVTAEGFAPGASDVFEDGVTAARERVKVVLTAGGSAVGRLLDIHGQPASGISISIHLGEWPGTVGYSRTGVAQRTNTADDGSFLFEGLTPGPYTLYTHIEGKRAESVPDQRVELEIQEGERTVVAFAQISQSFVKLHGRVMRNSEPLARAAISIHWADRSRGYLGKSVRTNSEGRFTIVLDEGANYRFQVSPSGPGGSVFREIAVPSVERYEVEISFETGSLSGFLLDPHGEPVAGLGITAFGKSAEEGGGSTIQSTKSQADGTFEFLDLVVGTYTLRANSISNTPDASPAPKYPHLGSAQVKNLKVRPGELRAGVELRMNPAAAVTGTVTDEAGNPVPGAAVEFRGTHSPVNTTQWSVDTSGKFLAGGLEPGRYRMRATRHTKLSAWASVDVQATATTEVEDLVLQAGSLIRVEALNWGELVGRTYARIRDEDGLLADSTVFSEGKGQLGPVLPGTYTVTVKTMGEDAKEASTTLVVDGEPSLEVKIELP